MPKATTPKSNTPSVPPAPAAPSAPPNPRWNAFTRAGVSIKQIVSRGYRPLHNKDHGHHMRIAPDNVINHIAPQGGGFQMILERTAKPWPGFAELGKQGVDINDLRCDVCNDVLMVDTTRILEHMKPHIGARKRREQGGRFNITLTLGERTMISDQEILDQQAVEAA